MTSTPLVDVREQLAAVIAAAVPGVPVHTAPPANVAPPAVTIGLGGGEQVNKCAWDVQLVVTVLASGADNDPIAAQLDQLLTAVVPAVASWRGGPVSWQQPAQIVYGGATLYGAVLEVSKIVDL